MNDVSLSVRSKRRPAQPQSDPAKTALWLRCLELALQHKLVEVPAGGVIGLESYAKAADGIMKRALKAGEE